MSPRMFDELFSYIGPVITRKVTTMRRPISPKERLAVTFLYLVAGDSMQTISFSYRLGHSTVCHIIDDTCQAIWEVLSLEFLCSPQNSQEWKKIADGFTNIWNFSHCVGAIDGKHILMQAPANYDS